MDNASSHRLNPSMRASVALCGFLLLFASALRGSDAPAITLQPVETNGFVGQFVSLSAAASGLPPVTYQWTKNSVHIPGATNATLAFTSPALTDTGFYQFIATNASGTAASISVWLTITKRPQTIAFPAPTTAYTPGTAVPLTASASSGLAVTLSLVSGSASLSGTTLVGQGGNVVVRATQAGNATFDAATTVERTFTFVSGALTPFFTTPPANLTVNAGSAATFRALALGTPAPTYQWQKDGVDLAGATAATFTLASAATADAARYTVVAKNAVGSTSASATLVVQVAPEIVTAPADQAVFSGDPVTLSVVANAIPAPTYQWRRNGTAIAGATRASYALAAATVAQAGRYDVVVTNALGSVTSAPANLTVTARDFTGAFFGAFGGAAGSAGDLALHVRSDGTAVFLGHLPTLQTAIVTTSLRLAANGEFSLVVPTLAAAPRPVTLRGQVRSETGELRGTVPELGLTFTAQRTAATGPGATRAGFYSAAVIGSANARGYAIVGADGQAFLLTGDSTTVDSVRGTLDAAGALAGTSVGRATISLTFANGGLSGTARATGNVTFALAGASEALAGTEHLSNLSIRANTNNANPLITGFVITGNTPKQVLIRAAGPAIAAAPFNVANAHDDPNIQVFRGATVLAQNDDWGTPAANVAAITAAATRVGAFPFRAGSTDAALLGTLAPGAYTVVVGGGNGIVLAEVYEVLQAGEAPGARRLGNLSARGLVAPGNPLIAGLVIVGTAPQRVLIRGVGPSLAAAPFNLANTLPNPQLTLFRGATALRTNDDWFREPEAALVRDAAARAGAFAFDAQSLDSALLLFLEPGAYTVQVNGANNAGNGLALVEVYDAAP
jgi:hypothetical protein